MLKSIVLVAFHTKLHQTLISAFPMGKTGENLFQCDGYNNIIIISFIYSLVIFNLWHQELFYKNTFLDILNIVSLYMGQISSNLLKKAIATYLSTSFVF